MQFLGLNSKHFSISASYSMCECVKTKNAYYYGVQSDLKLEMCSFVMSFNDGVCCVVDSGYGLGRSLRDHRHAA